MPESGMHVTLEEHSIAVAENARNLCQSTNEATRHAAYCAGLLHDLGKLSPSYQELFGAKLRQPNLGSTDLAAKKVELAHKYGKRQHAIFSCMLAWCLLYGAKNPHRDVNKHVLRAILCHHGKLKNGIGWQGTHNTKFKKSQDETAQNWEIFQTRARVRSEYPQWLNWEKANNSFVNRIDIGNYGNSTHTIAEYLRGRIVFSALVQGDYLSFSDNRVQAQHCRTFGAWMGINAKKARMINADPSLPINDLRDKFQKDAILKYDIDKCLDKHITIIEAPTGIGKTALLLDIMSRHANKESYKHCYYFAPLIALNSSFVELVKDKHVVPKEVHKFVLTYNHALKSTLDSEYTETGMHDDLEESDDERYNFAYEAFQYPLIITTTQRLILTLYANHKSYSMKLVSLAKSLMIIDEIQTIPRFMRLTTMELLDRLCKECNSRVVLVSATVPAELKRFHMVGMDSQAKSRYLELTSKAIDMGNVDANEVAKITSMSPLVMFNTRKKAAEFYGKVASICKNTLYLSTGITRGERLERINLLVNEKRSIKSGRWPHKIVVSTQVLEAGVDVSFGRIWRELAPMDSIVQAMGRLDRCAEMRESARITIFGEYDPKNTMPYDSLDVKTTYEMLKELECDRGSKFTSVTLYNLLDRYYDFTMKQNTEVQTQKEKFEDHVKKQHYEMVWDMVAKTMANYNTPIIIPNNDEEWKLIHSRLKSTMISTESTREQKTKNARARRNIYTKYSNIIAEFPETQICKIRHMLVKDLLENGVAFPKKEHIGELYDRNGTGLDWHLLDA